MKVYFPFLGASSRLSQEFEVLSLNFLETGQRLNGLYFKKRPDLLLELPNRILEATRAQQTALSVFSHPPPARPCAIIVVVLGGEELYPIELKAFSAVFEHIFLPFRIIPYCCCFPH